MFQQLKYFYFECLLPELVDPRLPRGMPIRNPREVEEIDIPSNKSRQDNRPISVEPSSSYPAGMYSPSLVQLLVNSNDVLSSCPNSSSSER